MQNWDWAATPGEPTHLTAYLVFVAPDAATRLWLTDSFPLRVAEKSGGIVAAIQKRANIKAASFASSCRNRTSIQLQFGKLH